MFSPTRYQQARRSNERRAFSLFELLTVVSIIGLVAGMAILKFGHTTYEATDGNGFSRRLALDLAQARRRAIATGDDHYVQFTRSSGVVVSYAVVRDPSGSDYYVDDVIGVPTGVSVTTGSDTLTYDFTGALTAGGTSSLLRIDGTDYYWNLTIYHATGRVEVDQLAQP